MKKITCAVLLILTFPILSYGQDEYLELSHKCQATASPVTQVHVLDKRAENQMLGFVQVGALNRMAPVKYPGSLTDSLARFFTGVNSAFEAPPELTIILNELYLSEKTEATSETGRLRISMRLFASTNPGQFRELFTIDSIYTCKGLDVTKKLLRSVSEQLCEIAVRAAENKPANIISSTTYTLQELHQIDNLEKQNIPVYQTDKVNPGIYASYENFKSNSSDGSAIVIDRSNPGNIKVYKWDKAKKRKIRVENKSVYAVCDGEILLKATTIGFYELKKINNDFYYVGQTSFSNANNAAMWGAAGGAAFGIVGGVVGAVIAAESERNTQLFQFKINYLKGNSILISKATVTP